MDNKDYFKRVYIPIKNANLADTKKTDRFDSLIYRVMDDLKLKNPNWVEENDILEMIIKTVALDNKIDEKDWDYYGERLKKNKGVENYMDALSKESLKDQMKEGRIIKITESDLKRIVKRVLKEEENLLKDNGIKLCSEMGIKTIGFCNSKGKVVRFGPCSKLEVKYAGFCEFKTKQPVEKCAKLGVKTNAICYVNTNQVVSGTER